MVTSLVIFYILEALVIFGAINAFEDNFFLISQMKRKGYDKGLPFIAHFGMWGDFFLVSPLIALIVFNYSDQWTIEQMMTCGLVGFATSWGMHRFYVTLTFPESHTYEHKLTSAGLIHVIYMAIALEMFLLFYFCTKGISLTCAITVSIALAIHILFGTHVILGLVNPKWFGEKPQFAMPTWVTLIVVWSLLAYGSYRVLQ